MATTTIRDRIAQVIRSELGWSHRSQDWLAKEIGMSGSSMSKRMNGTIPFDVDELAAIASALDVPIGHLADPPARSAFRTPTPE